MCKLQRCVLNWLSSKRNAHWVSVDFDAFLCIRFGDSSSADKHTDCPHWLDDRHFKCNTCINCISFDWRDCAAASWCFLLLMCSMWAPQWFCNRHVQHALVSLALASRLSFFLSILFFHYGTTRSNCPKPSRIESNRVDCSLYSYAAHVFTVHI